MLRAPFMTTEDVAKLLKVSNATVRTWIRNQELRAVKLDREFRVAKIDLERFVEARATIASPLSGIPADQNGLGDDA